MDGRHYHSLTVSKKAISASRRRKVQSKGLDTLKFSCTVARKVGTSRAKLFWLLDSRFSRTEAIFVGWLIPWLVEIKPFLGDWSFLSRLD